MVLAQFYKLCQQSDDVLFSFTDEIYPKTKQPASCFNQVCFVVIQCPDARLLSKELFERGKEELLQPSNGVSNRV